MHDDHHWNRRAFLKMLGLGAGACALPMSWGCGDASPDKPTPVVLAETGPELKTGYPASLLNVSETEVDLPLQVISGALPTDLQGHIFVVAALPWGDGTMVFNGDGMMYRLDLGTATPMLKSRVAKSPCYWADVATRTDADYSMFKFVNAGVTRLGKLGVRNELNTAFVPFGDRLAVTYDGGRPWELDVNTLEVITPIGWNKEWKTSIPFVSGPFQAYLSTAHPFWDSHTEEMFTVNYGQQAGEDIPPFTNIMRWDGEGDVLSWTIVDDEGKPYEIKQSIHQLAVTRDYVVVVDCAFLVENEQILNSNHAKAQEPDTILYIVKRDDLKAGQTEAQGVRAVIPRESVHLTADYDNPMGQVTLYIAHNTATDASEWLRPDDVLYRNEMPINEDLYGLIPAATDINYVGRHTLDASSGKVVDSSLMVDEDHTWGVAFLTHHHQTPSDKMTSIFFNSVGFTEETLTKRIVELYAEYPHRRVETKDLPSSKAGALFHYNPQEASIVDAYLFPNGRAGSSPQFVPRPNAKSDSDGYLVCTVVSDDGSWKGSSGDEFWVFDAQNLKQGPLTRLGHKELSMGFTLHTAFLPELKTRTSTYALDIKADYNPILESQTDEVKALFDKHVFPKFA